MLRKPKQGLKGLLQCWCFPLLLPSVLPGRTRPPKVIPKSPRVPGSRCHSQTFLLTAFAGMRAPWTSAHSSSALRPLQTLLPLPCPRHYKRWAAPRNPRRVACAASSRTSRVD
eukprot:Mycagemm_TRINITY_DN10075_c1_g1::TRINITY_DN10075_c1_g1_i1::g.2150::m.2150 type:complete len:113 gc:universal TRINITY_DN10075_c1_g1_i1:117-455(+)